MNTRRTNRDAASGSRTRRPLTGPCAWCGGALLLLLGWASAAPAGATTLVISSPLTVTSPITIGPGDQVLLVDGGSVTNTNASGPAVIVDGGTLLVNGGSISGATGGVDVSGGRVKISGGSISGNRFAGVFVQGGTVSISGGTISGQLGVVVDAGTVSISGGTISGLPGVAVNAGTVSITGGSISPGGVVVDAGTVSITGGSISDMVVFGGTVSIYGCGLRLSGSSFTGTLEDGSPISGSVFSPGVLNLINQQC